MLIALLDTFIHPTIYLRLSTFISRMCKVPVPFHQNVSFLRVQKCVHFDTTKKTDKRSLNLWTNPFGTSHLKCILFDTIPLKMNIKKESIFHLSNSYNRAVFRHTQVFVIINDTLLCDLLMLCLPYSLLV